MRAEERLRVLTSVMRSFAEATTDLDHLLDVIALNAVEVLCDACIVLILTDDGEGLVPIAAHAADADALDRAHALLRAAPFLLHAHPAARSVLESRGSLLVPHVDAAALGRQTTSAYLAYQAEQGIHSLLAVALHADGRALGLMTLTRYRDSSPPFDEDDRALAVNLADHASLALVNARLYVAERTARLAAEEAMRSRRAAEATLGRLRAIVEALPDAIVVTDAEGRIEIVNEQTERTLGWTRQELERKALGSILPESSRGRRKDGTELPIEITESALESDEGRLVVTAFRDVTERKRAEETLLQARDAAELANRELESFSYSVAHDLQAPLRGMNAFARILLEDHGSALDADGRTLVDKIAKNAIKMGHLIDGLLGLARLNRTPLGRKRIDLSAMVRASLAQALADTDTRPATTCIVEDDLTVLADPTLLQALVDNLVGNAVKFTARTEHPRIELGRRIEGGEQVFFLRDNGAGFDMQFAGRLFEPFQRLHDARDFKGTGIGLATAFRIVARHGGRLWAEGRVAHGATFYFTLERAPAAREATPREDQAPAARVMTSRPEE